MTTNTDQKLRDKLIKEKNLEMTKTIEMIKKTHTKRYHKNTIPEALISSREKEVLGNTKTESG